MITCNALTSKTSKSHSWHPVYAESDFGKIGRVTQAQCVTSVFVLCKTAFQLMGWLPYTVYLCCTESSDYGFCQDAQVNTMQNILMGMAYICHLIPAYRWKQKSCPFLQQNRLSFASCTADSAQTRSTQTWWCLLRQGWQLSHRTWNMLQETPCRRDSDLYTVNQIQTYAYISDLMDTIAETLHKGWLHHLSALGKSWSS